jgi:outer membrane lipoprotein carrier protein
MRKMLPLPWERAGERVLFVLLLATSFPALANGLDDFLAFNAATQTASGSFEQQAFDRAGKVVDRSSGTLAFARPGKFRWVYDKPHKQVLVADGHKLWIYDPDLAQVTVKRIGQAISSTPAALLAGRDDITKLFTLRDAGTRDGLEWVEALPKAKDTGFDRVRLGLKDRTLAAMELYDQLGGHTVLKFTDLKANPHLLPGTFEFTPPKGADVIDEDAAPGK